MRVLHWAFLPEVLVKMLQVLGGLRGIMYHVMCSCRSAGETLDGTCQRDELVAKVCHDLSMKGAAMTARMGHLRRVTARKLLFPI